MEGEERRGFILEQLKNSQDPLSGAQLAQITGVSRQVIVQDIALLRAANKNILSTNKGYILFEQHNAQCFRVFPVNHTTEQIEDELNTIVDYGGRVKDVIVEHSIYGQISVDLCINNKNDVKEFVLKIQEERVKPLKELTNGIHYHTVEACTEKLLDTIQTKLYQKGYLLEYLLDV